MPDFSPHIVDNVIREKEEELQHFCSPYSGNCYEVALALSHTFPKQSEGFWSIYADTEFLCSPEALPLHIVVQIQGELFDAGGRLYQSNLLEEYAPKQDPDLLRFDETFPHENVVDNDILRKVIETYQSAIEEKYK